MTEAQSEFVERLDEAFRKHLAIPRRWDYHYVGIKHEYTEALGHCYEGLFENRKTERRLRLSVIGEEHTILLAIQHTNPPPYDDFDYTSTDHLSIDEAGVRNDGQTSLEQRIAKCFETFARAAKSYRKILRGDDWRCTEIDWQGMK